MDSALLEGTLESILLHIDFRPLVKGHRQEVAEAGLELGFAE